MQSLLIIRADATTAIGTGHVMRSLALAQAWRARIGDVLFVSRCQNRDLRRRLTDFGRQMVAIERPHPDPEDWQKVSRILADQGNAWVAVDGYHFDVGYHEKIRAIGNPLLVVDDTAHLDRYEAEIVLNQNINAEGLSYATASFTRLLLGTRYVLLREEFVNRSVRNYASSGPASRLLVTLGGGNPNNMTLRVIQALDGVDIAGFEAAVVVGAANPNRAQIEAASSCCRVPVQVVDNARNMAELMAWAEMAVTAGGSTCWELAYMGVPSLAIVMADNQLDVARGLDRAGVVENMGRYQDLTPGRISRAVRTLAMAPDKRARMHRCGRELVDGKGAQRVLTGMLAV